MDHLMYSYYSLAISNASRLTVRSDHRSIEESGADVTWVVYLHELQHSWPFLHITTLGSQYVYPPYPSE